MRDPPGEVAGWKALPEYLSLLSTSIWRDRSLDAVGQKSNDDPPPFEDEDEDEEEESFSDRRHPSELYDVSGLLRSTRRGHADGDFERPEYSGKVDAQRGLSGREHGKLGQRSDAAAAAAGWKRSTPDDVALDAAFKRVKEQLVRRRLLEKWLKKV